MFVKEYKKVRTYFAKYVDYNSLVHLVGGVGIGILIASPFAFPHPVRWGAALIALGLLGHLYPLIAKK